jgi:ring-1,2-phenylacetyl-CoA epoxidase subunit PaaE
VKETEDCVSLSFIVPDEFRSQFDFFSGQYLTLKTKIKNEEVRRSYSLCSEPSSGIVKVAIKQVENGTFSTFANRFLSPGDIIESLCPSGNFQHVPDVSVSKNYVLFAAGSGITPIISIAKSILKHEPKSHVTLIYGNKGFKSVIFREEIEALKNHYLNQLSVVHIFSKENLGNTLQKGRIDREKCEKLFITLLNSIEINEVYICGPEQMTLAIREVMLENNVPLKNIHLELFGTTLKKTKSVKNSKEESFDSSIGLILDGDEYDFPLNSNADNILDAAQKIGIDLPYACKGGVCCTCKAKVLEGQVSMDVNYALEDDEVEAGYILTCQAHPKTEKVIISFDD